MNPWNILFFKILGFNSTRTSWTERMDEIRELELAIKIIHNQRKLIWGLVLWWLDSYGIILTDVGCYWFVALGAENGDVRLVTFVKRAEIL
jgi:hypothetical protein